MFIPFIFNLDITGDYDHLCVMYKYLTIIRQFNWPIIAHERYFKNLDTLALIGLDDKWLQFVSEKFEFGIISQSCIDETPKYIIPQNLEDEIIGHFPSRLDAWLSLLRHPNDNFEQFIEQTLDSIQADFDEPIEGLLCFYSTESLRRVAAKRGIPIIHNELGPLRPPIYGLNTGYFDFSCVYGPGEAEERYRLFQQETKTVSVPQFDRKELLQIFIADEYRDHIQYIDIDPPYELCNLLTAFQCGISLQYTHMTSLEMQNIARKRFSDYQIIYRGHPSHGIQSTDDSISSFHTCCKCKRVAGIMSNVLFEAMLVGRIACAYGPSPFYFMCNKGIDDPSEAVVPLEFLNFVIFGYLIPWDLVKDIDYLRFRLTMPSEVDIYMKHYNYYKDLLNNSLML